MQITVKLYFEDEVRRVSIGDENGELTFTHLKSTVDAIFPALRSGNFRLMWKDDDDDLITISSNPEFLEAVSFMTKSGNGAIAKFHVKVISKETKPATSATFVSGMDAAAAAAAQAPAASAPAVHEGVQCDQCGVKPIIGTRYKCTGRFNYDLCATCEAKGPQPHPMTKIEDPSSVPSAWQTFANNYLPGFGGRGGRGGGCGRGPGGPFGGLHGGRGWGAGGRGIFGPHHGFPHHGFPHHGPPDWDHDADQHPHPHPHGPSPAGGPVPGRGSYGDHWRSTMANRMRREQHRQQTRDTAGTTASASADRAVHNGVSCNECGILPIVGPRYKCAARENYDLCSACEARSAQACVVPGATPMFPMLKIERPEDAPGTFIYMFNKRAAISGGCPAGYRRRNLDNTGCGVGAPLHRHVCCNECGDCPIVGPRFKCAVRDDFDLCSTCEAAHPQPYPMVKIYHPQHRPSSIVYAAAPAPAAGVASVPVSGAAPVPVPVPAGAVPVASVQSQVHTGITCDGCGVSPITGSRFKCTGRNDFDLCATCERAAPSQPYPMLKISYPQQAPLDFVYEVRFARPAPSLAPLMNQVHFGVRCDECGQNPIQGPRYKCAIRNDFDLCSTCESARPQPYPVVKVYDPAHHPSKLVYVLPAVLPPSPTPAPATVSLPVPVPAPVPVPVPVVHVPTVPPAVAALPKPSLRFVRDRTLPDGTTVQAGQLGLVKIWDVRNDGPHAWPAGSMLTFAGGDLLHNPAGAPVVGAVAPLRAGEEGQLSVQLCVPRQPGRYVSYYRMQTAQGQNFGQRLWADIVVAPHAEAGTVLSAAELAAQEEADRQLAEEINALMLESEVDTFLAAQAQAQQQLAVPSGEAPQPVEPAVEVITAPEPVITVAAMEQVSVNNASAPVAEAPSGLKVVDDAAGEWDMVGRCVTILGNVLEEVEEQEAGEGSDAESEYSTGVHQPLALSSSQQGGVVPDNMAASYDHICGDMDFDDASAAATDDEAATLSACLVLSTTASACESKEHEEVPVQAQAQPSVASPMRASQPVPVEPMAAVQVQEPLSGEALAQAWHRELQMLGEMGFVNTTTIVPLLQRHLCTPLSQQQPASDGSEPALNTAGLHAVLTDLLSSA